MDKNKYNLLIDKVYIWFKENTHVLDDRYKYIIIDNPHSYLRVVDIISDNLGQGYRVIIRIVDHPIKDKAFQKEIEDIKISSINTHSNKKLILQVCFIELDNNQEIVKDYLFSYSEKDKCFVLM